MMRFFGILTVMFMLAGLLLIGYPATPETSVYADGHYGGGGGGGGATGGGGTTTTTSTGNFFGSTGDISVTGDSSSSTGDSSGLIETATYSTSSSDVGGYDGGGYIDASGFNTSAIDTTSYASVEYPEYSYMDIETLEQSTLFNTGEGQAVIIGTDGSVLFSQSGDFQGGQGSDTPTGSVDLHQLALFGIDLPEGFQYISSDVSVSIDAGDGSGGSGQVIQLDVGSFLGSSVDSNIAALLIANGVQSTGTGDECQECYIASVGPNSGVSTDFLEIILAPQSDAAADGAAATQGVTVEDLVVLGPGFAEENAPGIASHWATAQAQDNAVWTEMLNQGGDALGDGSQLWTNAVAGGNPDDFTTKIVTMALSSIQGFDALLIPPDQADDLFDRAVLLSVPFATDAVGENASLGVIEPGYVDVTTGLWQAMRVQDRLGTDAVVATSLLGGQDFEIVRSGESAMGTDGLGDLLAVVLGGGTGSGIVFDGPDTVLTTDTTGEDDTTSGITTGLDIGDNAELILDAGAAIDVADFGNWSEVAAANYIGLRDPNDFVSDSSTDTLTGVAAALGHGVGELIDSGEVVSDIYRAWVSELEYDNPNADLGGFSNEILSRSTEVDLDSYTTDAAVGLVRSADGLHTVPDDNLFSIINTRPVDLIGADILDEIFGTLTTELIVAVDNEQVQDAVRIMAADRLQEGTFAEIAAGGETAGLIYETLASDVEGFVIIVLGDDLLVEGALDAFSAGCDWYSPHAPLPCA